MATVIIMYWLNMYLSSIDLDMILLHIPNLDKTWREKGRELRNLEL